MRLISTIKVEKFYTQVLLILTAKFIVHWFFSTYLIKSVSFHVDTNLWRRAAFYGLLFIGFTLTTSEESRNKLSHLYNSFCALSFYILLIIFRFSVLAGLGIAVFNITLLIVFGKGFFGFSRVCEEKLFPRDYWLFIFSKMKFYLAINTFLIFILITLLNFPGFEIPDDFFINYTNHSINRIANISEYTIENYEYELKNLSENNWQALTKHDRIELMQIIANIELNYLGVNRRIKVEQGYDMATSGMAKYNKNIIKIKLDDLCVIDCTFVILHEVYHFYQYEVIKSISSLPTEFHDLLYYEEALKFKQGFRDYITAGSTFEEYLSYKNQYVETTADEFSYTRLSRYWDYFETEYELQYFFGGLKSE